jgi:hypothetical protein
LLDLHPGTTRRRLSSSQIYDAFLPHFIGENPRFDSGVPPNVQTRFCFARLRAPAELRSTGVWLKHTYPGSAPLPEREPAPDNRWQRGGVVAALYLAERLGWAAGPSAARPAGPGCRHDDRLR